MTRRGFKLRAARREALFTAAIVAVAAVGAVALASRMSPGTPTSVVEAAGGALLALALGGFIYEIGLRDSVTSETIHLLELKQDLVATGLTDVDRDTALEWRTILEPATDFQVLIATPFGWLEQTWPHILEAGSKRKISVTVFLPDPDGGAVPALAEHLSKDADELRHQLREFQSHLVASWENAETGPSPLREGSLLSLKPYTFFPTYDLVATDDRILARVHSLASLTPGDPTLVLSFRSSSDTFPVPWLKQQFERLSSVGAAWEKEVRR